MGAWSYTRGPVLYALQPEEACSHLRGEVPHADEGQTATYRNGYRSPNAGDQHRRVHLVHEVLHLLGVAVTDVTDGNVLAVQVGSVCARQV